MSDIKIAGNRIKEDALVIDFDPDPTLAANSDESIPTQKAIKQYIDGGPSIPYKIYVALISQTAENDPDVDLLQNTMEDTVVWTRINPGTYNATCLDFGPDPEKVWAIISQYDQLFPALLNTGNSGVGVVQLQTVDSAGDGADTKLLYQSIEIRVYP